MQAQTSAAPRVTIRKAEPGDAAPCGRICYEAFSKINTEHGFPPDFPSEDVAVSLLTMMFSHPDLFCVVAESEGRIVGSNCLDERSTIAGVGPITVDPDGQNQGAGRMLMQTVLHRARERGFAGVRLVQAAFHSRSLSLYAKLGFQVREILAVMQGPAIGKAVEGYSVRRASLEDVAQCGRCCLRVHGHDRSGELRDAIAQGSAVVVERGKRITGYTTELAFFGHAVAESEIDLQVLIASAESFGGPGILLPLRNAALFRWCLDNGLRVVETMNLMTVGLYNEPQGAWLPSISF